VPATYLDRIIDAHRRAAADDPRPVGALIDAARDVAERPRGLARALGGPAMSVIAEVKRASPSKGPLAPDLDPAALGRAYEAGGASALSVLTDRAFFAGDPADLAAARAATALPVLRKDFTVCPADVADARLMGADAVLLIAAALAPAELAELLALATELDLDALVEVHDETEAETAAGVGATLVGVNQRDLVTFEVDAARAERVAKVLPDGVTRVAESGIRDGDDVARLADVGYHAVLVGETLVTAPDPAAALGGLLGMVRPGAAAGLGAAGS
jgi:indole-3-glycerol phosphate synthase